MATRSYCCYCGNNPPSEAGEHPEACSTCLTVLQSIPSAVDFFSTAEERYGVCCFGLTSGGDALYLHSDCFSSSFKPDDDYPYQVCVEAQVLFYQDHCVTRWIFDNDNYTDSFEFGDTIHYDRFAPDAFWAALEAQLSTGAEVAFNQDNLSCPSCGYHYSCDVEPNHPIECATRHLSLTEIADLTLSEAREIFQEMDITVPEELPRARVLQWLKAVKTAQHYIPLEDL